MKKLITSAAVIGGAVLFLFLFSAGEDKKREKTVAELKSEWDSLDNEMQHLLKQNFQAHASDALKSYTAVIENPEFTYTVFKARAGRRAADIKRKLESLNVSAEKTDRLQTVDKTEEGTGAESSGNASVSETGIQKEAEAHESESGDVQTASSDNTPQNDSSGEKTPKSKSELTRDQKAAIQYNRAFMHYEQESYSEAHEAFRKLLAEYGNTGFCSERKAALHGYISRSRILSENPGLTLYLCEEFEYPDGSWKGEFIDSNCHNGSKGAVKSVSLDIPGMMKTQAGVALLSDEEHGLFPLESGQRINFSYLLPVPEQLHVHIWDKAAEAGYYYNLNHTESGSWITASIPLTEFRSVSDNLPVPRDIKGECWYLGFSSDTPTGQMFAVDSIVVTGERLPDEVIGSLRDEKPGLTAHLLTEHFTFSKVIAENLNRKLTADAKKGTVLFAGDYMTQWLHTGLPLNSRRELRDSRVTGKHKGCREIAENIGTVLDEEKPEVTLIMSGLTDILLSESGALNMAYEKCVSECLKHGSIPVLFGLPVPRDPEACKRVQMLNDQLMRIARLYQIPYFDTAGILTGDSGETLFDERKQLSSSGKHEISLVFQALYRKINTYVTSAK